MPSGAQGPPGAHADGRRDARRAGPGEGSRESNRLSAGPRKTQFPKPRVAVLYVSACSKQGMVMVIIMEAFIFDTIQALYMNYLLPKTL